MRKIQSKNPYTGEVKETFDFVTDEELQGKIEKGAKAFIIHKKKTFQQRQAMIWKVAQIIEKRSQQIAEAITFDMGKPITQSEAEIKKVLGFCSYYGKQFQEPQPRKIKLSTTAQTAQQRYMPTGIIYLIVPFNFPFFAHFKAGLPNLLLGNVILCRSADSCPLVAKITEQIFHEAGFSNGQYQDVWTSYNQLETILKSPRISGVSFTGSSRSGASIAEVAGKHLKKAVMELGGNDAFVLLEDGDVNLAIVQAIKWRCVNAGQVCTAPKRFIIAKNHYEKFKEGLIEGIKKFKAGDPSNRQTQMGPLAREDLYDILEQQLKALPKSSKIIFQREDMKKPLFPITVIERTNEVWDEELFGPVFQLFRADNFDEALEIANHGTYGLSSSVFSASRGEQFATEVRCGIVGVNFVPVSNQEYPIGGVEKSGFGRECERQGYLQFANLKTFVFNSASQAKL